MKRPLPHLPLSHQALSQLIGLCICLLLSGCSRGLESSYGTVRRPSINGVGVFVDMLRAKATKVVVLPAVSERLTKYSTVILLHHDFGALSDETAEFLHQEWNDHQTIVVAVRDSDWAIDYWDQVAPQLEKSSPTDAEAARKAASEARDDLMKATSKSVVANSDTEFGYGLDANVRTGIDRASKVRFRSSSSTEIQKFSEVDVDFPLRRKLTMPPWVASVQAQESTLWKVYDEPLLISFQEPGGPRFLILGTTAPLLNGGMIQPGNRRLAAQLIDGLNLSGPVAVVTSSYFLNEDEDISMWRFARIFPHPWILGQSLLALILFCWWMWPIFGRPHSDQTQEAKRFGRHVAAVGELLAATGDVKFAVQRIHEWQRVQEQMKGRRG